jgi:MinD-like ATPase involved in chromosome partitioning or flagellar assembly
MKAIIVYSGKGGVGKTTTTANIARLLAEQGNKVFIIDADINTPSMNTEFEGEHPQENIWVHSSGNMFAQFIYLEKSMVRQYLESAKKKLKQIKPDFVLIDTPPSVTNVHIELLSRVKVSYILFVTQPTKLSNQDVLRTMDFFHERCGKVKCGIVENMCYDNEKREYPIKLVAQIPMQDKMNTDNLLSNAKSEFQKIVDEISVSESVVLEEYSTANGYDENFDITNMSLMQNRRKYVQHELKYDDGTERTLNLPAPKFLSVRTWEKVRRYIKYHDDTGFNFDARIDKCDERIVGRMVNHFKNDDNAYFMVINAPNTEIHLITGEIGICSLLTGQRYYYELPRVNYQTSRGNVVLFPDEIMPVDIDLLQQQINEGYLMLSDGRYIPPKETVEQCFNAYGSRVGLLDGWERIYDDWMK